MLPDKIPTFGEFASAMIPTLRTTAFHTAYYRVLQAFAEGRIRKLMVTIPPQHGKSLGSSVLLPAYVLGLDPDLHVAIASYSASLARRFNKRAQRLIESAPYAALFPDTTIKGDGGRGSHVRTADLVEIIGHTGELTAVGREGPLTGNTVDVIIIDDLYKDAMEANSPVVRENCWEWYTSVVRTRLHNLSRELIVFTRWHEEDLIGMIAERESVVPLQRWAQMDEPLGDGWLRLDLQAIKESPATEIDPRSLGEALWPERHSEKLLLAKRRLDPLRFEAMYQGNPNNREGLLYGDRFLCYDQLPATLLRRANYTDTADTGDDYLCSISYVVDREGIIYIVDLVYSREHMEVTEVLTAEMIQRSGTRDVVVESNNGGRGFARALQRLLPESNVSWFHQGANKEARILSNASTVLRRIRWPHDWQRRWPDLASHLMAYSRRFRSNRWHDAPDVLTAIVEQEASRTRHHIRTAFKTT